MMIKRKETVSVFMDGEASEFESASVLKYIKQEPLLERCWEGYHMIGDAMRNQVSASLDNDFCQRLSRALDQEDIASGTESVRRRSHNGTAGFALAASVSAVAMVGLLQFGQPGLLTTANTQYETDIQKQHLAMADTAPAMAVDTALPIKMDNQALAYASFDSTNVNRPADTAAAGGDLESSVYGYLVNYSQYAVATPLEGSAPNVSLVSYRMD